MNEPPAFSGQGEEIPSAASISAASVDRRYRPTAFRIPHPDSLAHPERRTALHRQIEGDPFNVRQRLQGVERLSWSIYLHGLLENLVVIEQPSPARVAEGYLYQLKAGSRRHAAIGLLIQGVTPPPGHPDRELGLTWKWPEDRPLPIVILGSDGTYEHLIENIDRSDPHPWEIGRRVHEILQAGVSSRELGTRLGRSNGWVNRYAHIGEGLSPELIAVLIADKMTGMQVSELTQLATLRDRFGDPDGKAQIDRYRERFTKKRRKARRMDKDGFRAAMRRLQHLRSDTPVPALIRPIVEAVVRYLDGGEPPKFRALEEDLLGKLKRLEPEQDDE